MREVGVDCAGQVATGQRTWRDNAMGANAAIIEVARLTGNATPKKLDLAYVLLRVEVALGIAIVERSPFVQVNNHGVLQLVNRHPHAPHKGHEVGRTQRYSLSSSQR